MTQFGRDTPETPDWARTFDENTAAQLLQRDTKALIDAWPNTDLARQAHPSPDHFFPLLYAYGASTEDDPTTFPTTGFDGGSISMRSVLFG